MNEDLYLQYQSKLIYACLDDFSGISVMGGYGGGQDSATPNIWWQASVDFLYRNLRCGLIEANPVHKDFPINDPLALCQLFAAVKPADSTFWFYVQFDGTPLLASIVENHALMDWACVHQPLNRAFIEEVEEIYISNGVGFSEDALIPIAR